MIRKIIAIDEDKCTGCGLCATACHEGAIEMVDGKAKLTRAHYCDALGDCLPACPTGAIAFSEREAPEYDEAAVRQAKAQRAETTSPLRQWPVQIKLAPVKALYYDGADLLIAADCTAYACREFHDRFLHGSLALIGCPKLDGVDYSEKLSQIFAANAIRSITVVRMVVPCCGGMVYAVERAMDSSGKGIPYRVVTVGIDGKLLK